MQKVLKSLTKKLVEARKAKRLAEKVKERKANIIRIANEFYYSK